MTDAMNLLGTEGLWWVSLLVSESDIEKRSEGSDLDLTFSETLRALSISSFLVKESLGLHCRAPALVTRPVQLKPSSPTCFFMWKPIWKTNRRRYDLEVDDSPQRRHTDHFVFTSSFSAVTAAYLASSARFPNSLVSWLASPPRSSGLVLDLVTW